MPLFVVLVVAEAAWFFLTKMSERHTHAEAIKGAFYILIAWGLLYIVIIALFPAPPMPVRLSVYPLGGPNMPEGMGNQLASEIEEAVASVHPRWCVGAFHRLGMPVPAATSVPSNIAGIIPLIQLDWVVCGEWKTQTLDASSVELRLKLVRAGSHDTLHINISGETDQAIKFAATKITELAHLTHSTATIAPLTPAWRIACARTQVVTKYDTTQQKLWRVALHSDPKSLGGVTSMISYFIDHPGVDTLLFHMAPTAQQLIKIGDRYIPFLITIGQWHRSRGDKKAASNSWLRAEILAPVRPEIHYYLGTLDSDLVKTKYETTPQEHLERAVELDPGYELARMQLVLAMPINTIQHKYEKTVEAGLAINPSSLMLLSRRAYYQILLNQNDQGIATINQIIAVDPGNADAYYNLGIGYIQKGDTASAMKEFYKSYSMNGTVENLFYLATIYEERAVWDSAIYYYEQRYKYGSKSQDPLATEHARIRMLKLLDEHEQTTIPSKKK